MSTKKKSKYVFVLNNINIEKINQKYDFSIQTNSQTQEIINTEIPKQTTKLDTILIQKKQQEIVSFLDETKQMRKCVVSMIDWNDCNLLEKKCKYKCFWCKNYIPDGFKPIGAPIKFIPSRVTRTYQSEINKESYSITENVTEKKFKKIKNDDIFSTERKGYYETDGIFCSFNCCLAFIEDPDIKRNPMYSHSRILLMRIYNDLYPEITNPEILPAGHWRLLEEFGGILSIEKFRESFNHVIYSEHGTISQQSLGKLFEDRIAF